MDQISHIKYQIAHEPMMCALLTILILLNQSIKFFCNFVIDKNIIAILENGWYIHALLLVKNILTPPAVLVFYLLLMAVNIEQREKT